MTSVLYDLTCLAVYRVIMLNVLTRNINERQDMNYKYSWLHYPKQYNEIKKCRNIVNNNLKNRLYALIKYLGFAEVEYIFSLLCVLVNIISIIHYYT